MGRRRRGLAVGNGVSVPTQQRQQQQQHRQQPRLAGGRGACRTAAALAACHAVLAGTPSRAWRVWKSWDTRPWCESVVAPVWPFAYGKVTGLPTGGGLEAKGRTTNNTIFVGHNCTTRGAASMCHICEPIVCDAAAAPGVCNMQLQGVDWATLPAPVQTVIDTPWAVGPNVSHRHDYGAATTVCMWLRSDGCADATNATLDFSGCGIRCWGAPANASAAPLPPPVQTSDGGWRFPGGRPATAQGAMRTVGGDGSGEGGWRDGDARGARFRDPTGVAVDDEGRWAPYP